LDEVGNGRGHTRGMDLSWNLHSGVRGSKSDKSIKKSTKSFCFSFVFIFLIFFVVLFATVSNLSASKRKILRDGLRSTRKCRRGRRGTPTTVSLRLGEGDAEQEAHQGHEGLVWREDLRFHPVPAAALPRLSA
jgi:hypothetical protein